MAIENLFDSASSVMTVVSFTTFVGILWWTFSRSNKDFDAAANLPFADEALDYPVEAGVAKEERSHV
ncbi:cbb3-type cytochrome oxidase subunit 3 [Janthinobacterium sp. RB2R34]|uniref:cbb3-type cytochrome oxidase subunit 3 n=1 Tax=Janthinobacterium sp. RB2R34 TaxID=3424193 RepID=UPI003F207884